MLTRKEKRERRHLNQKRESYNRWVRRLLAADQRDFKRWRRSVCD